MTQPVDFLLFPEFQAPGKHRLAVKILAFYLKKREEYELVVASKYPGVKALP
jgi:hypothetical protein